MVAPGKIRGERLGNCAVPGSLRKKSELSSHQISIHGICRVPGSLRTSTPSSHQISRWSKREDNFYLRGSSHGVCFSQCPSPAMPRGRRYVTAASAPIGFTLRIFARGTRLAGGFQRAVDYPFRGRSRVVSRFGRLRHVPCGLEWLRFVVVCLFAGPTGGRQSALQVSWTFSFSTGCAESIELLFNSREVPVQGDRDARELLESRVSVEHSP